MTPASAYLLISLRSMKDIAYLILPSVVPLKGEYCVALVAQRSARRDAYCAARVLAELRPALRRVAPPLTLRTLT